jgi:hypothetical protein
LTPVSAVVVQFEFPQNQEAAWTVGMTSQAGLKRHHDEGGKPTGLYECPMCGELFKPNPADQGEMTKLFGLHFEAVQGKKKSREDVNQAAARIAREATKK